MPLLIVSQIQTNKIDRKVIKNRDKTAVLIISIKKFHCETFLKWKCTAYMFV